MRIYLERMLWCTALIALSAYALDRTNAWLHQAYWDSQFAQSVLPSTIPSRTIPRVPAIEGQALGKLEIPSIGLSVIYLEGDSNGTLRKGIGHIPGTGLPGDDGNAALAGHRDTFFKNLGKIQPDDLILITTLQGMYEYRVESTEIVDPDENIVLRDLERRPILTLVTCYPFTAIGPAPKRFIVKASLSQD